jgi:hypothetical protein
LKLLPEIGPALDCEAAQDAPTVLDDRGDKRGVRWSGAASKGKESGVNA